MAANAWTTEQIILHARNKASVDDTGAAGYTDADILDYLYEEMTDEIVPELVEKKANYLLHKAKYALVADQAEYRFPARAVGQKLRDVRYLNADEEQGPPLSNYSDGTIDDRGHQQPSPEPHGFRARGSYIELFPTPSGSSGFLVFDYYLRPGMLVKAARYRQVAGIVSTTQITLDSAYPDTAWTTSDTFDVHSDASGADVKQLGVSVSTLSGTSVTFSAAIDGSVWGTKAIEVGDYMCLEDEAAIPALPRELHPALGRLGACALLEAMGDEAALKIQRAIYERKMKKLDSIISDRVEANPKAIHGTAGRMLFAQGS